MPDESDAKEEQISIVRYLKCASRSEPFLKHAVFKASIGALKKKKKKSVYKKMFF